MANTLSELVSATSAQDIMVQALEDAGFKGDLSAGSPLYQLLIDPNAVIYALQVEKQDAIKESWSLLSDGLSEDGGYDSVVLENLFNNLRIQPTPGSKSSGNLQLVFNTNEVRSISGATFISPNGTTFVPSLQYTMVPSETYRVQYSEAELVYTSIGSGYAVDISVESSTVGEIPVASGDLFTSTINGLISASASVSFSGGRETDTLSDIVQEVPLILSETSMVSPVAVTAALYQEFPSINEMRIFRPGDVEMQRANKNVLGVDSGAADILLTTSARPSVQRSTAQGHLELSINSSGVLYNSEHRLGFAYRQPTDSDVEDMVTADEILVGYAFVEGELTDSSTTGLSSILDAGLETDSTDATTSLGPDEEVSTGTSILRRRLVEDSRYGNLPVSGSDEKDFYFSSYQYRVKFEFRTDWEDIDAIDDEAEDKVYAWVNFWRVHYQSQATGIDMTSALASFAESYGGITSDDVPRVLRVELPVYADSVGYAELSSIQEYLNDDSRRCFGQDYIVKTPHINSVVLSLTVSRDLNFFRFREDYFKTKIADYINTKGIAHTSPITTEHLKTLIFEEGPSTADDTFTLLATTTAIKHDGTVATETSDHIDYIVDEENGVTPRNSILSCTSSQIGVTYL